MSTVAELLKRARELTGATVKLTDEYNAPKKEPLVAFLSYRFLVPEKRIFTQVELTHLYPPYKEIPSSDSGAVVLHGHKPTEMCAAPYFCHLLGFKPTEEHNPKFHKLFYHAWSFLYGGRELASSLKEKL